MKFLGWPIIIKLHMGSLWGALFHVIPISIAKFINYFLISMSERAIKKIAFKKSIIFLVGWIYICPKNFNHNIPINDMKDMKRFVLWPVKTRIIYTIVFRNQFFNF